MAVSERIITFVGEIFTNRHRKVWNMEKEHRIFFHAGSIEGLRRLQAGDGEDSKILEVCGYC